MPTAQQIERELVIALESESEAKVFACYQCGKCTAACPFSLTPHRVMRHLQMGQVETALTVDTTWVCASCLACSRVCPKSADPAGVMKALRSVRSGLLAGETPVEGDGKERRRLTEVAAGEYSRRSHPLRSYFFANIHDVSRRGSRLAPVSNWMSNIPGSKLVAHHVLGVHKDRPLPQFVRPAFPDWFRERAVAGDGGRGRVLLFHDTFMDYDAPQIGVAATEVLESAGYDVALADNVCCGRPMISKGYVDKAAEQARVNVERLHRQIGDAEFIVGCEPSCLLTVREEYPRMLRGDPLERKAHEVAARCLLIDEFLVDAHERGEFAFDTEAAGEREVLFHGHCQQKAEADAALSLKLLRLAGYRADMIRAPCCGMAGAFGFEREHYEASRAAFGRALGPALAARPQAELVVVGISCRKQIEHFAGRPVRHLVEALRETVRPVSVLAASPGSR